jgi:hypothetical protein
MRRAAGDALTEIDFEHHSGAFSEMAASNNVRSVNYIFRDSSTGEETSFVKKKIYSPLLLHENF